MRKKVDDRFENPLMLAKALEPFAMVGEERSAPARARGALVAAAVASESPTVVEHGAASDANASDPDLATTPSETPSGNSGVTAIAPNSDGSDYFKLDLGPSPRLSDSLSGDDDDGASDRPSPAPWIGLGGLVILALVGSIGAYLFGFLKPPNSTDQGKGAPQGAAAIAGAENPEAPKADITVEYNDGTIINAATLSDAINLAAGKPAEVVLRNKETLHLEVDKPHRVSGGDLRIRAEKGTSPVIGVAFKKSATWLLASANTSIRFSGMTFELTRLDQGAGNPPTLIEAGGNVEFDHCAFDASSGSQIIRVLKAEGRHTKVAGCWFQGFDEPLAQSIFPGADVEISQSMFVRPPEGDNAAGWPLSVRSMGVNREGVPKVTFDHVTNWGAGLLRAEGFSPSLPLQVEVSQSVLSTHALLMWSGTFPEGLNWTGSNNIYEVSGAAWVVRPPDGFNAVENSPSSLDSWTEGSIQEEDARVMDVRFVDEAPAVKHRPGDFALMNVDEPKPGANPGEVGPSSAPVADQK